MTRTLLFLVMCSSLWSCRQASLPAEGLPDGFAEFYEKFHADSAYQMAHIAFPLAGVPDNFAAKNIDQDQFQWQPADWVMHHAYKEGETVFDRTFNVATDNLVEEVFRSADKSFAMIRRFARTGDEWRLIYYAGMNPVRQGGAPQGDSI